MDIHLSTPAFPPPRWAQLELEHLSRLTEDCENFYEKYFDQSK